MPKFRYRAISADGGVMAGELDARDEAAAISQIRALGALPSALEVAPEHSIVRLLNTEVLPRRVLRERERIAFTRSLATLIEAGVAVDRALQILRGAGKQQAIAKVAGRLLESVREGRTLADALDREPGAFPRIYRMTVRAGEAGAQLGPVLTRLAETLETTSKQRGEIRSALIYPAFLIVTAVVALGVLLGFVVPSFEPLLADAGVDPPRLTQVVLWLGGIAEEAWAFLLALILLAPTAVLLARLSPRARLWVDDIWLRLPVVGRLARKQETARFVGLLGSLLANGVGLPAALRLVRDAIGNAAIASEIEAAIPAIEAGAGLAQPLAEGRQMTPLALQLIEVGEESGRLVEMLQKAAEILTAEARRDRETALAILTPTITLVMGLLVALIVSSILLMLLSLNELAF